MLIRCPECGKEVSDKSEICVSCGYPIQKNIEEIMRIEEEKENKKQKCPYCGSKDIDLSGYCNDCGMNTNQNKKKSLIDNIADGIMIMAGQEKFEDKKVVVKKPEEKKEFNGIYKHSIWKGKKEVYCPRCNSENCSHYVQKNIIPEKTKTSYSANLNPLKPFTLVNKKEKVIRKEQTYDENKIICNDCGYTFY